MEHLTIYLGADHRGWQLKNHLLQWLQQMVGSVVDLGSDQFQPEDDYVDYAATVARHVVSQPDRRGIVICGSGVGVDIVANKIPGARCGLCSSVKQVRSARQDDDINLLALAADYVSLSQAEAIVDSFLRTPFANLPRFQRRLNKIKHLELSG